MLLATFCLWFVVEVAEVATTGLATQLLNIKDFCECLAKLIETMENAKYIIKEAVQAIHEFDFGESTCNIYC